MKNKATQVNRIRLVWHVDDGVAGFRTAQTKAARKRIHLVEADGASGP